MVNTIHTLDDIDECIDLIADRSETAFVIVSEGFASLLTHFAKDTDQIRAVYIYCSKRLSEEKWIN